ncbi:indolethylamine N-methyltransferase-like [Ambystoma mexicanum]|uniref:indolethylamine N-methyltransferase-like n=1 Tax=Ambystoma mexicanum TaxID=8296 RepID=UPI0037E70563
MASSSAWMELYQNNYDPASGLSTYYAEDSNFADDSTRQVLTFLVSVCSSGSVKGDTLIQYGGHIGLLFAACDHFNEIFYAAFAESHIKAVRKWVQKESGALDWSFPAKLACELEGKRESWTGKEEMVRRKMTKILKCEGKAGCLVLPSLPTQVDGILVIHFLEMICTELDAFCKVLKDMACQLKIGGHLLLNVLLGATFFMVGTFKFPVLCLDEEIVNRAVCDAGLVIKESKKNLRANNSQFSVTDFSSVLCLSACKERNVQ